MAGYAAHRSLEMSEKDPANDLWFVRLARPAMVFIVLLIVLVQFAVLPMFAVLNSQSYEYMPETALAVIVFPLVTYIVARTIEKMKGVI